MLFDRAPQLGSALIDQLILAVPVILTVTVLVPPEFVNVMVGATSLVPLEEKVIVDAEELRVTSEYSVWMLTVLVIGPAICIVALVGNVTT